MPIIIDYAPEREGLLVSTVLERCGYLLQDEDHVRWSTTELFSWINEAVQAIINLRPPAGIMDAVLSLQQGARQELDSTVSQLVDVSYNLAADGVTAGRAISRTDRSLLDLTAPDWASMKPAAQVRQFMYDDRTPMVFYVYPPVVAGTKVRASVAAVPEEVASPADTVPLRLEYADSVVNYVCYRAKAKDSEYANAGEAVAFYNAFQTSMGLEAAGAQATSPNGASV